MPSWFADSLQLFLAIFLVLLNGFFVAAEFAFVKVRPSQIEAMVRQGRPFSSTAQWLVTRLDNALSACQLGITLASLGLGWVGEPAFARLITPLFHVFGITSETVLHVTSFLFAFSVITVLHLVIGEQAPKIYAIRRPEMMAIWCAVPLKWFMTLTYPLLSALSWTTSWLLSLVGLEGGDEHGSIHSEEEIRQLVHHAHAHGQLTRSEQQLIHGVFEFDDLICRRVMVPRNDVVFFDVNAPMRETLSLTRRTKHTRYPLCDGSLDAILGVVHIKDLLSVDDIESLNLRDIMRPPKRVPETVSISKLLRHFQATHQLMAIVSDEHGTMVGIVTLENVLEPIIGSVEDEFDAEPPEIAPDGPDQFIVLGAASVELVNRRLGLNLDTQEVDTFSGLLMHELGRIPEAGDEVQLAGAHVEVLEANGARAERNRVTLPDATGFTHNSSADRE